MQNKFKYFKEKTGIEIPQNIVKHYLNGKNGDSEFMRLFKSQIDDLEKESTPYLNILISEKFAERIINEIFKFSLEERITYLFNKLCEHHNYKKEILSEDIQDFVVEEILYTVFDYNYKENRFEFPLIQKAYETFDSNTEEIKVVLVLWGHCGGEGGIIVRGENIGYDIGYTHSDLSEIENNGKFYSYLGFPPKNYESLHKPV